LVSTVFAYNRQLQEMNLMWTLILIPASTCVALLVIGLGVYRQSHLIRELAVINRNSRRDSILGHEATLIDTLAEDIAAGEPVPSAFMTFRQQRMPLAAGLCQSGEAWTNQQLEHALNAMEQNEITKANRALVIRASAIGLIVLVIAGALGAWQYQQLVAPAVNAAPQASPVFAPDPFAVPNNP
jgi:hypothetical protein